MGIASMLIEAFGHLFLEWIQILKAKETEVIVNEEIPTLTPNPPSVFDDLGLGLRS